MKKRQNFICNPIRILEINSIKFIFLRFCVFMLMLILSEFVQAQGCLAVLKIKDPSPVCYPLTVDLTSPAVTPGSTDGLKFSYYIDPELTVSISNPSNVGAGTYYIKGVLTGSRTAWVACSVKVTVFENPKVVVTSLILKMANETVDLTSPTITMGSDNGLSFSYWIDPEATRPLASPESAGKGVYYIKGTSVGGCYDIQSITVNDK
jgi:hypothetical protein